MIMTFGGKQIKSHRARNIQRKADQMKGSKLGVHIYTTDNFAWGTMT